VTRYLLQLPAYRVGAMLWGGLAAIDLARSVAAPAVLQSVAIAVLVGGFSRHVCRLAGVLVAGTGWLLVNGFLVGDAGLLAWHGSSDVVRLAVLVAVALVAGGRR
jgi:hypothetical protein